MTEATSSYLNQPTMSERERQIADWRRYERVRQGGRWNMFDPRARMATGLSAERYSFVMENYDELRAEADRIEAQRAKGE